MLLDDSPGQETPQVSRPKAHHKMVPLGARSLTDARPGEQNKILLFQLREGHIAQYLIVRKRLITDSR